MRSLSSALATALVTAAAAVGATGAAGTGTVAPVADPAPNAYPVVLSGDFTGDAVDDLFFHSPGTTADVLYDFAIVNDAEGISQILDIHTFAVNGSYRPVAGDFTGDDVDDIFWYQPGTAADIVWDFGVSATASYVRRPATVNGTYRPVAGDFTADGVDDVFFYGPGSVADSIWELGPSAGALSYRSVRQSVSGSSYQPVAGHFSSVLGGADIFWYNPAGTESLWDYPASSSLAPDKSSPAILQVSGTTYRLAVADLFDDDHDDIVFVGPGSLADSVWDFYEIPDDAGVDKLPTPEALNQSYTVAVGLDSYGEGTEDFLVYNPANTRGLLYDIYVDGEDFVYERQTFEPSPVTELPPAAASAGSSSHTAPPLGGADGGRGLAEALDDGGVG